MYWRPWGLGTAAYQMRALHHIHTTRWKRDRGLVWKLPNSYFHFCMYNYHRIQFEARICDELLVSCRFNSGQTKSTPSLKKRQDRWRCPQRWNTTSNKFHWRIVDEESKVKWSEIKASLDIVVARMSFIQHTLFSDVANIFIGDYFGGTR